MPESNRGFSVDPLYRNSQKTTLDPQILMHGCSHRHIVPSGVTIRTRPAAVFAYAGVFTEDRYFDVVAEYARRGRTTC